MRFETPPNPVEPPGPAIHEFVQALEVSAPRGEAIHTFVELQVPPSPIVPGVPPSPVEPGVVSDLVLDLLTTLIGVNPGPPEANPGPPDASPGPPNEPPGPLISTGVHLILGDPDLSPFGAL